MVVVVQYSSILLLAEREEKGLGSTSESAREEEEAGLSSFPINASENFCCLENVCVCVCVDAEE